jgi:2-oxoglutarate ferredoxin oxidoreductase subunit alpha
MVRLRAKIALVAQDIPPIEVFGPEEGKVLVLGWGSTFGSIRAGVQQLQGAGHSVAHAHLRHLNPLPSDLGALLSRYERILVPEMNMGQLLKVIRAEFLVDAVGFNKIQGRPFRVAEIVTRVEKLMEEG